MHDGDVRYVEVDGADIAFRVLSDGPADLLYFYGLGSHIDAIDTDPFMDQVFGGLATFSRIIVFDRRGTGASDRLPIHAMPTWEEWTRDISAVLDSLDVDDVALVAGVDAGPIAVLFAAMHPARVRALVLNNTTARYLVADDYPIGVSPSALESIVAAVRSLWGSAEFVRAVQPNRGDDTSFSKRTARRMRASVIPSAAAAQLRYILETLDVRAALPSVQAPTLVLHTSDNPFISVSHGRYLADHIAGAKYVEVPGDGIGFSDDQATFFTDELTEFLTGERPAVSVDRVLTTVLFTDIVGSTDHLSALGDARWRQLLDAHDREVREQLRRFGGHEVSTTGDGFCSTFDGPARAIRCAGAICDAAHALGIAVRAGVHTGECEIRGDDLAGLAVHVAARVSNAARPSEVLVSPIVKELVSGSGIDLVDAGERTLKGVPGPMRLFALER